MKKPLILVTNDDGVHAAGIRALAEALSSEGEVWIVAPDVERSASSQALTIQRPLRTEQLEPRVFAVDGTPADCVGTALLKLLPRRPALVAAGINRGANLGDDIFYSGTVGGAREGTFFGVPSIALSLAASSEFDYTFAAEASRRIAALVIERGLPERTLLNVNVPPGRPFAIAVTRQGRRFGDGTAGEESGARSPHWREEVGPDGEPDEIADVFAVRSGLVSVTPLHTDTTNHRQLGAFREWHRELVSRAGVRS